MKERLPVLEKSTLVPISIVGTVLMVIIGATFQLATMYSAISANAKEVVRNQVQIKEQDSRIALISQNISDIKEALGRIDENLRIQARSQVKKYGQKRDE